MRHNPYVGPRPYERGDQKIFFGRNREARDLLALILAERVVLFYAPSGAGKTSLLNAKIIPALEEEGFHVLPKARVGSDMPPAIRHKDVKNVFTQSVLMTLSQEKSPTDQLNGHTLLSFLKNYETHPSAEATFEAFPPFLLILDQFEELFTTHQDRWQEAEAFFQQLNEALEALPEMGVLFTMREDYVAELDPYAHYLPGRLRARFRMERLGVRGALESAKRPAEQAGCAFEPGVAEKLVDNLRRVKIQRYGKTKSEAKEETDVLGPYVEPVQLQVVCNRLWDNLPEQEDNAIQWDEVEKFGDIDRALIDFYENALTQTMQKTGVRERDLRHWFGKQLITPLQTRGLVLRGENETNGLANEAVDLLDDSHLIHADIRAGARWYEISHDRLVEPILQSNRIWEAARQTPLRITARRWQETKNPGLLYRDEALQEALTWIREHPDDAEPYEQEFLEVSQEAARVRARVRRLRTAGTLIGALVLITVSILGWLAARNGLQAYSRELAAQSRSERTSDRQESIFLAREGVLPSLETWWENSERTYFGKVETSDAQIALRQSLIDFYPAEVFSELPSQPNQLAYSPDGRYLYAALPDYGVWIKDLRLNRITMVKSPGALRGSATWSIAPSPDGRLLAVSGDDGVGKSGGLVGLLDIQNQRWVEKLKVPTPRGTYDEIYSVAFSPDGQYLATGGDYDKTWRDVYGGRDGLVRIWTVKEYAGYLNSTMTITLTEPQARVCSVAFGQKRPPEETPETGFVTCPEDDPTCDAHALTIGERGLNLYLAAGSHDSNVYVWELTNTPESDLKATPVFTLTGHTGAVRSVAFNPSENLLASASDDRTIRLWDLTTGQELFTLVGHTGEVNSVAFSTDGQYLISGSRDRTVRLWDGSARNPNAATVLSGPDSIVLSVAYSPDGKSIAAGDGHESVHIWDLDAARQIGLSTLIGHQDRIRGIAYNSDGKFLAVGDNTGATNIWSMASGEIAQQLPAVGGKMWGLAYSPDGQQIVTCSEDDKSRVWDAATGDLLATLSGHEEDVEKAAFSPDGRFVVTVGDDHKVLVWNTESWTLEKTLEVPDNPTPGQSWSVAYSPDGQWIAAGRTKGPIDLWAVQAPPEGLFSATFKTTLQEHTNHIMSLAFSPDSQYLASGSWDNTVEIWDLETYQPIGEPLYHPGYIYSVAFSPDGRYLATGARDGIVRLWEIEDFPSKDPKLIGVLEGHTDLIWSIAFSPDSKYLASGSWDGTIRRYLVQFEDVLDLSWDYLE